MNLPSLITLYEVGPRGSLQNEKTLLSTEDRLELLRDFIDAGFTVTELGSFMHPKAVPQMADTNELYRRIGSVPGVELRALIPNLGGVQCAAACGCKKVKLNASASRQHNLKNLNMLPEESVTGFASCVEAAKENGIAISDSIPVPFAPPWEGCVSLSDVDAIIRAYLEVEITEISLSDTSGMTTPDQVYDMYVHVWEAYPQVSWRLRFHNTRGLAMINILASMEAGMIQSDSPFGGLGGYPFVPGAAGNISIEDIIYTYDESGIATGTDSVKVMSLSYRLRQLLGHGTDSYVLRAGCSRDLTQSQSD